MDATKRFFNTLSPIALTEKRHWASRYEQDSGDTEICTKIYNGLFQTIAMRYDLMVNQFRDHMVAIIPFHDIETHDYKT